jgi:hypothetical protein
MPTPLNTALYAKAKKIADAVYDRPSAYKSGFIVKKYKEMGGKYKEDGKEKKLKRWFKEEWANIGGNLAYPVYRPTKRVSKNTPLTPSEIKPSNLKKQIKLKQVISSSKLPPFVKKIK